MIKDIDIFETEKEVPNYKDYLYKTLDEFQEKAKEWVDKNNYKEILESKNENIEELESKIKSMEDERKNLYNRIDDKEEKIYELEKEIERLKQRTIMPDYKQENDMLRCQHEEAKQHIETLEKELDKANSESAEYFIRWGDAESKIKKLEEKLSCAEQEINRLNTENTCLKEFNEKSDKRIQHLINSIKNMSEVL